jgi:hypothetical protein
VKFITFAVGDDTHLGLVRGDQVIDLADASRGRLPTDMLAFLRQGEPALQLAREFEQHATA